SLLERGPQDELLVADAQDLRRADQTAQLAHAQDVAFRGAEDLQSMPQAPSRQLCGPVRCEVRWQKEKQVHRRGPIVAVECGPCACCSTGSQVRSRARISTASARPPRRC